MIEFYKIFKLFFSKSLMLLQADGIINMKEVHNV
jgi:hypothetical protein